MVDPGCLCRRSAMKGTFVTSGEVSRKHLGCLYSYTQ